jgi:hypothetical protein
MRNCGLALLSLTGSLKGDRPNQIVTLLGVIAWICVTELAEHARHGRTELARVRGHGEAARAHNLSLFCSTIASG